MITVFGSITLDAMLRVRVMPQLGETVLADEYALAPGGKGANQALAAARAGAEVALFGCLGADGLAESALALLREDGVNLEGVSRGDAPTALAAVCLDSEGGNRIVAGRGANALALADAVPDEALGPDTILLVQLELPIEEVATLACRARSCGARVILNAAPAAAVPGGLLDAVSLIVVNEIEAAMLAPGADGPHAAGEALAARTGRPVVVTLGEAGAVVYENGRRTALGTLKVRPVDTTGAGDAFVGALAAALDRGASLLDAAREGAAAGALACLSLGAQTALPRRAEIAAGAAEIGLR